MVAPTGSTHMAIPRMTLSTGHTLWFITCLQQACALEKLAAPCVKASCGCSEQVWGLRMAR
eukprot:6210568-Pleurochrysis_carterae.AAC.2